MLAADHQVTAKKRASKAPKAAAKPRAEDAMAFSLTALARELGVSRDRLGLLLHRIDAEPVSNGAGGIRFRVRDAHKALAGANSLESMSPFERKAHWDAVHAQNRAMEHARQLIPVAQVEFVLARYTMITVNALETLPDIVERDCGAPPAMVNRIERRIDVLRTDLAEWMRNSELPFEHGMAKKAETAAARESETVS